MEIVPTIRELLGVREAEVLPIVVGQRGAMPNSTVGRLRKLGVTGWDLVTVSMIALRSSIEILNEFIDYGRQA